MKKPVQNPWEAAEIVAIQALNFIAGDARQLGLLLAETGIGPNQLRAAAADPQFLGAVLDFVLGNEATLEAFAKASELQKTSIAAARDVLGDPKWEPEMP